MTATTTTTTTRKKTRKQCAPADLPKACADLRDLQRQRVVAMRFRIMLSNRLKAVVAGTIGYDTRMSEKDRKKKFAEASDLIEAVAGGKAESKLKEIILLAVIAAGEFDKNVGETEKTMRAIARTLPVAEWSEAPEQRGFGLPSLAVVVGECGDLSNYANPAKVWKRMGCAPWTFGGKTAMGATWKAGKGGKLPAEEWERFGYNPRRRSAAYLIGEALVKANQSGPYRARYLEAKVRALQTHPEWDWKPCTDCGGEGGNPTCKCGGCGRQCRRAHLHGMLLATKRLLRELWVAWNRPARWTV